MGCMDFLNITIISQLLLIYKTNLNVVYLDWTILQPLSAYNKLLKVHSLLLGLEYVFG